MFKEKRDGLCYVGSDNKEYELLEGFSSNNYTSDIIFIMDRNELGHPGVIIDFVYGGFRNLAKDYIEEKVEEYIKNRSDENGN